MPGINNISNVNNLDIRKIISKLSFQVGEVFEAKVLEIVRQGNELILKMVDGWQFTAEVKIPLDMLPKGLVKFKVMGHEEGKLQIAVVLEQAETGNVQEESIQTILKQQNLPTNHADFKMLKSMVGHDIPLTKENISSVKTIIDFKEKISANVEEEDIFIRKYLQSKEIELNSTPGKNINQLLKGFFNELKKVSVEDLVTLKENGIDITEDNLKSFNKVFKEDIGLFKQITEHMNKESSAQVVQVEQLAQAETKVNVKNEILKNLFDALIEDDGIKSSEVKNNVVPKDIQETKIAQIGFKNDNPLVKENSLVKENLITKVVVKEVLEKPEYSSEVLPTFKEIIKNFFKSNELAKGIEIPEFNELTENIKSEIAQKTDLMKDVIRSLKDGDWSLMKSSINDIKVFNTVSNQYYYMDVPINVNQREYECKLLVKDDRKKGKKIDSKNVKMFVSVKTINMGKVDAYIKVSDRNVSIDLKCNENYIKVFEDENHKLINTMKDMNYNVKFKIERRVDESNIVTTREFFQDNAIGSINVMV